MNQAEQTERDVMEYDAVTENSRKSGSITGAAYKWLPHIPHSS